MKVTLSWLGEFLDIPTDDPAEIADAFESLGHEVEEWHVIDPSFTGVVVGEVLEVIPHPNADKVRLTKVNVGDEILDIICGAWNFEAGAIVPVAVPGAVLGGDFEITRRDIRGETSNGMICSETELDLGDDAEGIMVLNEDYPKAAEMIGEAFDQVIRVRDVFYDLAITPNRPDCLSVYGLARDLAARFDVPLRGREIDVVPTGEPTTISVSIEDSIACPRFTGRQVRNVTVGRSPHWLRRRLDLAGIRPISNVVDASNYAMVEFGYPTHAFDVDRLGSTIVVRRALDDETIVTLDGQVRVLNSLDIAVTDGSKPVAIGGVMGGATTEVHDDTTAVFIEAAYWDPASILMSSKRLGLRSEASARFERGADPSFCSLGADRVAQLLTLIAGGQPAPEPVDVNPGDIQPWIVEYPLSETRRILGISLDTHETTNLLTRLSFDVEGTDPLLVKVPTRRPDVQAPVDLVEEIARLHGFDAIPATLPQGPGGGLSYRERRLRSIRDIMTGAGYYQLINFSFIGAEDLDRLGFEEQDDERNAIDLVNPINEAEGVMRTTLLPGLLKAASSALSRKNETTMLFETGDVFLRGSDELPDQPRRLAFLLAGESPATWSSEARGFDLYDGTGVWQLLSEKLGIADSEVRQSSSGPFHPGRGAEILVEGETVGMVGEIRPSIAEEFGLSGRVVAGEIAMEPMVAGRAPWQFIEPSVFPPVVFDLAFAVPIDTPASIVVSSAETAVGGLLESVNVFDVFVGDAIGEGLKSIAINVRLRAGDRTLTDSEIVPIRRAIAESVAVAADGELRGEI